MAIDSGKADSIKVSLVRMRSNLDDYLTLSFREYTQANFTECLEGLMIGCGPYPMTAVCFMLFDIARQTGVYAQLADLLDEDSSNYNQTAAFDLLLDLPLGEVSPRLRLTCLDVNEKAIICAGKIARALQLHRNFHFVCSNALQYSNLDNFNFIHIAAMVAPKEVVLQYLLGELGKRELSCNLLMRFVDPDDIRSLLYEPLSLTQIQETLQEYPLVQDWRVARAHPHSQVKTSFLLAQHGQTKILEHLPKLKVVGV